jgi:hypothetical protein
MKEAKRKVMKANSREGDKSLELFALYLEYSISPVGGLTSCLQQLCNHATHMV